MACVTTDARMPHLQKMQVHCSKTVVVGLCDCTVCVSSGIEVLNMLGTEQKLSNPHKHHEYHLWRATTFLICSSSDAP